MGMKCVCGYEGEDFDSMYLREVMYYTDSDTGDDKELDTSAKVFICPRCGTLKILLPGGRDETAL